MCRVVAYSGVSLPLEDILFEPSSALVRQVYAPQKLAGLNLAGFGMASWQQASPRPLEPLTYRSTALPFFDSNLRSIAAKLATSNLLAHVRGIPHGVDAGFGAHNLHPFSHPGCRWLMAHNGDLAEFGRMRGPLLERIGGPMAFAVRGTTDSEAIYALVMSCLDDPATQDDPFELLAAVERSIGILREVRSELAIGTSSSVNLFVSDGVSLLAVRFALDFGCFPTSPVGELSPHLVNYLSLWYTAGERFQQLDGQWQMGGVPGRTDSVLISSEPLSIDTGGWVELPEYSALFVDRRSGRERIGTATIDA